LPVFWPTKGKTGGRDLVVKSSTKKRLVELGVPEEHAHKLADDANMDAIKQMSVEQVAKKIGIDSDSPELEKVMGIIREQGTRKRTRSRRITISQKALDDDDIPLGDDRFNVLNHHLVPHHELLPADEEATALSPWKLEVPDISGEGTRLAKELLPKILITDPAVQVLKEMAELEDAELPAGWLTNRVVRVKRYSISSGTSTAYRLIVEEN
jgi:DNA-directed RNA polymerase subunit H (RpoH/RPB5)